MKKTLIFVFFIVSLILTLIYAKDYQIKQRRQGEQGNKASNEEDVLWVENFGTKEYQYEIVGRIFNDSPQYFLELLQYYQSLDYKEELAQISDKSEYIEIDGDIYSVSMSESNVTLCIQSYAIDASHDNYKEKIADKMGFCHDIIIVVDKKNAEVQRLSVDVTNKDEREMVWLIWTLDEMRPYGYELSEKGWSVAVYGAY